MTYTGTVCPAQYALFGRVMLYISFPGQVFSISNVCVYSAASGNNPLTMLMAFFACHLPPNTPGRVITTFNSYMIAEAPCGVCTVAGILPGTVKLNGKRCTPLLKRWAW